MNTIKDWIDRVLNYTYEHRIAFILSTIAVATTFIVGLIVIELLFAWKAVIFITVFFVIALICVYVYRSQTQNDQI